MPSRRSTNDLVLFSSADPQQIVHWLCDTYGLQTVLQAVAQYQPKGATAAAPAKRAYKRGGAKKGASKKGAKKAAGKQGAGRGRKRANAGGGQEVGNA